MSDTLDSIWFDGRSPRPQHCTLCIHGTQLVLSTTDREHRYEVRSVRWPERRTHGMRQAVLPDGGLIQHADAAGWDMWWQASGQRDGVVVRWMQSWRATLVAVVGAVVFVGAAWQWGVPWAAQAVAQAVPASIEAQLGEHAMARLQAAWFEPSRVPAAQQDALRLRFQRVAAQAYPADDAPVWRLHFHRAPALGPNALALPGGDIVVTDELVALLADQPDVLMGVLAHELAHVHHHDGLDMLVRASLVSALAGVVLGDASGLVAALPAALATQSYSREAERRADAQAAQTLHDAGLSPSVMTVFFERLEQVDRKAGKEAVLPIAIASHPGHDERERHFRDWRADRPAP